MSDMAERIGEGGFEKMDAEEKTLWGKIRERVMQLLDSVMKGLGMNARIKFTNEDIAYILYKSWKNLRNGGKESLADQVADIAMRERTGYDRQVETEAQVIKLNNEGFNNQLQRYLNNEMGTNELLELGMPTGKMRHFLPDQPIVMRQRILSKGSRKKHNIDLSELVNLPEKISNPIFIFQRADGNFGVLTELKDRDGKNICVAIEVNKSIQDGGDFLEVNDIRSLHGRDMINIIMPILHNGSLKYANKEKGLSWISSASTNYQQEISKEDLDAATNIVENFENPTIEESENDILFRDGEMRDRVSARDRYEERMRKGSVQAVEAFQDSMRSLLELYKAIEVAGKGKKARDFRIEDIASYENAYTAENAMSSTTFAQSQKFHRDYMVPVTEAVNALGGKTETSETDIENSNGISLSKEMPLACVV